MSCTRLIGVGFVKIQLVCASSPLRIPEDYETEPLLEAPPASYFEMEKDTLYGGQYWPLTLQAFIHCPLPKKLGKTFIRDPISPNFVWGVSVRYFVAFCNLLSNINFPDRLLPINCITMVNTERTIVDFQIREKYYISVLNTF